jgi:hypothetical protein
LPLTQGAIGFFRPQSLAERIASGCQAQNFWEKFGATAIARFRYVLAAGEGGRAMLNGRISPSRLFESA